MNKSYELILLFVLTFCLLMSCNKDDDLGGVNNGSNVSCTDGLQNGNETGVDCGGDCDACPDKASLLLGSWKVQTFTGQGGLDLVGANRDELFLQFLANGDMPKFSHFSNGVNSMGIRTYTLGGAFDISFFFDGEEQVMMNCEFSDNNNTLSMTGVWIGQAANATLTRVTSDLCSGVDCNDGTCYFGSCHCDEEFTGEDCSEINFPNTFRLRDFNLLVFPYEDFADTCIPAQSTGFDCDHADAYIQIREKDTGSIIYHTEMHPYTDGCNPPCQWSGDIYLNTRTVYEILFWDEDSEFGTPDELRAIAELLISRDFTRTQLFSNWDPIITSPADFSSTVKKNITIWSEEYPDGGRSTSEFEFTDYEWR